jgi:hypothetical protein
MILKASEVGCPHVRARFFCVALHKGSMNMDIHAVLDAVLRNKEIHLQKIKELVEPPRMSLSSNVLENRKILELFGNSVVPACCAYAFHALLQKIVDVRKNKPLVSFGSEFNVPSGVCIDDTIYNSNFPKLPETKLQLLFDPAAFKTDKPISSQSTSPLISAPTSAEYWSTPRHGANHSCNYLTERSIRDLATQVRFEVSTPAELRAGSMNPQWTQWLMGFPKDYIC